MLNYPGMKGNPKVIAALNEALKEELTAINQYFLHAEMCENWHFGRLGDFIKKQSIDEMKHAEVLIERILFLDATPTLTDPMHLTIGKNVKEQLESDLKLEIGAVALYNEADPHRPRRRRQRFTRVVRTPAQRRRGARGLAGGAGVPDPGTRLRALPFAADSGREVTGSYQFFSQTRAMG